jgi:FdhD protein
MIDTKQPVRYILFEKGQAEPKSAEIVGEGPVSLTVNGDLWLTFMCTPKDLESLAVGFLYNEGIIQSTNEIASVHVCASEDNIDIWLHHNVEKPLQWRRTSGCTGGATSVTTDPPAGKTCLYNGPTLMPDQISELVEALFESQDLYRRAGGAHTSVLSDGQNILAVAEDIGRHNTLDKIAGHCLREHIELSRGILVTTGRVSSEMLQKAVRLGAAIVISRTSPSSLSIQMAEQWGVTLIGYARRDSFRIYTHPERILTTPKS